LRHCNTRKVAATLDQSLLIVAIALMRIFRAHLLCSTDR